MLQLSASAARRPILCIRSCFVALSTIFPCRRGPGQERITMWNKERLSFSPCLMDLSKPAPSTVILWKFTTFHPSTWSRSRTIAIVGCVAVSTITSYNSFRVTRSAASFRSKRATCSCKSVHTLVSRSSRDTHHQSNLSHTPRLLIPVRAHLIQSTVPQAIGENESLKLHGQQPKYCAL